MYTYTNYPYSPSAVHAAELAERRGSKLVRQDKVGSEFKHGGHFEIHDLSKNSSVAFYVSHDPVNLQHLTIKENVSA